MKKKLANLLLDWAAKLHPETVNVRIKGSQIIFDLEKAILKDGNWHGAALYAKFNFMANKAVNNGSAYIDGVAIDDKPLQV